MAILVVLKIYNEEYLRNTIDGLASWHSPFIPVMGRERQIDCYEFEASLFYNSEFQGYIMRPCLSQNRGKKEGLKEGGKEGENHYLIVIQKYIYDMFELVRSCV